MAQNGNEAEKLFKNFLIDISISEKTNLDVYQEYFYHQDEFEEVAVELFEDIEKLINASTSTNPEITEINNGSREFNYIKLASEQYKLKQVFMACFDQNSNPVFFGIYKEKYLMILIPMNGGKKGVIGI